MHIDWITFIFVVAILGTTLFRIHKESLRAHAHTQEMLRDIARFLGTDRR
jgi:hypothetical protein